MKEKILMSQSSSKYLEREKEYINQMKNAETDRLNELSITRSRNREILRNRKNHEREFHEAWESINLEQWKNNQKVAKERRELERKVDSFISTKRQNKRQSFQTSLRKETFDSIDDFDRKIDEGKLFSSSPLKANENAFHSYSESFDDKPKVNPSSDEKSTKDQLFKSFSKSNFHELKKDLTFIDKSKNKEEFLQTQREIKENQQNNLERQQRLKQKRRKFLREYDSLQDKNTERLFQRENVWTLVNFSKSEQEEHNLMTRVLNYKNIILENRSNRQEIINNMNIKDSEYKKNWEKIDVSREENWYISSNIESQNMKSDILKESINSSINQSNLEFVQEILDKIFDLTDWVVSCRQVGLYDYKFMNPPIEVLTNPLPEDIWKDGTSMLTSTCPISSPLELPKPTDVTNLFYPFSFTERPLTVNSKWLFQKPFNTFITTRYPSPESNVVLVTPTQIQDEAQEVNFLDHTSFLAQNDADNFRRKFNSFFTQDENQTKMSYESIDNIEKNDDNNQSDPRLKIDEYFTPEWVLSFNSKYILGEAIISSRCVVEPLPKIPLAVINTSHIPLKLTLMGLSDHSKSIFVSCLKKEIPQIKVISLKKLIKSAYEIFTSSFQKSESLESISELNQSSVDSSESFSKMEEQLFTDQIFSQIYHNLSSGSPIPDDILVQMIVLEIKNIPLKNNGFVLEDFPNSKSQSALLMKSLSGIEYDSDRPQPIDKASIYAPVFDRPPAKYDPLNCGIDKTLYIHYQDDKRSSIEEKTRKRYNTTTGDLIHINSDASTKNNLVKFQDSIHPNETIGIEMTLLEKNNLENAQFLSSVGILEEVKLDSYLDLNESFFLPLAIDFRKKYIADEIFLPMQTEKIQNIETNDIDSNQYAEKSEIVEDSLSNISTDNQEKDNEDQDISKNIETQDEESEIPKTQIDEKVVDSNKTEGDEDEVMPESEPLFTLKQVEYSVPSRIFQQNEIPHSLAEALVKMWNTSELQSINKTNDFFGNIRNIRYQMVQRRRVVADSLILTLVKLDDRQELFDKFIQHFNSLESDMRFDPDCISELHLLKLELFENLNKLSELRKQRACEFVNEVVDDAIILLFQHHLSCEATAFAQSELQRFYTSLNIIFDYLKSVQGFKRNHKWLNELEPTLPIALEDILSSQQSSAAKDQKKDPKKSKDDKHGILATREPIVSVLIPSSTMKNIPELCLGSKDQQNDPKSKGKPKDKKESSGVPPEPFSEIESKIYEKIDKWTKENFKLDRSVYEGDESYSNIVERAIWHEAEKAKNSIINIRSIFENQKKWLLESEEELNLVIRDMIEQRHLRELYSIEQASRYIDTAIHCAAPLEELWLVSPDAFPIMNPLKVWETYKYLIPRSEISDSQLLDDTLSPLNRLPLIEEENDSRENTFENSHKAKLSKENKSLNNPKHFQAKQSQSSSAQHKANDKKTSVSTLSSTSEASVSDPLEEKFNREKQKYFKLRKKFEKKLYDRRKNRESEFIEMGMSASCAKLAAYNELLLDEQHKLEDFEFRYKPHRTGTRNKSMHYHLKNKPKKQVSRRLANAPPDKK